MKMAFLKSRLFTVIAIALIVLTQSGCTKDTDKPTEYPIQGLWEGTYTVGPGNPVPSGTSFYFSLSIYPGGKMSYRGKGYYQGSSDYISFADGTWALNGNNFTFAVTTVNYPGGGPQHAQTGKATYNSSNGTLTDGVIYDNPGVSSVWSMTKVK